MKTCTGKTIALDRLQAQTKIQSKLTCDKLTYCGYSINAIMDDRDGFFLRNVEM
jgi:hypothetical protein